MISLNLKYKYDDTAKQFNFANRIFLYGMSVDDVQVCRKYLHTLFSMPNPLFNVYVDIEKSVVSKINLETIPGLMPAFTIRILDFKIRVDLIVEFTAKIINYNKFCESRYSRESLQSLCVSGNHAFLVSKQILDNPSPALVLRSI